MTSQLPATESDRSLDPATSMDAVTLRVGDLEQMSAYYQRAFAFKLLEEHTRGRDVHRVLGRGTTALVRLIQTPDLPPVDPRQAGLYHTAFLFPDQASLAATVYRAAQVPESRYVGSADHLVSEAFYFTDPEGNGVELYRDRPRETWTHRRGQIVMTTDYLDPNLYLQQHLTQEAWDAGPRAAGRVGHVHLQVGDVARARHFYVDLLGFEVTQSDYPGALFVSAGGYHHHLAMNVWNSRGAGPRAATLGLGDVAVQVPARADLDALVARMRAAGEPVRDDGASAVVVDPWGTQVTVRVGVQAPGLGV